MANNQTPKLRAFVRIDGSGRVVPGAPIFQANKPKVGQWREIPLYYRGDGASSSTTTTSTTAAPQVSSQTTVAGFSGGGVCSDSGNLITVYWSGTLGVGTALYTNLGLTAPYLAEIGNYIKLYFNGQYNQCYVTGVNGDNTIYSASPC